MANPTPGTTKCDGTEHSSLPYQMMQPGETAFASPDPGALRLVFEPHKPR